MHRTDIATIWAAIAGAALGAAGHPVLQAVVGAAFIDLITGLARAWVCGNVESNRLGGGIYKILAYLCVGVLLVLIGRVSAESLIASNALAMTLLLREALSIVENLHETGQRIGKPVPGMGLLAKLMRLEVYKRLAEAGDKGQPAPETENTHV
jgi:phage-related holin